MGFSTWILSIAGVILLGVLAETLVPEGKMSNSVKSFLAIATMFVIIAPLPSLADNISSGKFKIKFENEQKIKVDNEFLQSIYRQRKELLESSCVKTLNEKGYRGCKIELVVSSFDDEMKILLVNVNVENLVAHGSEKSEKHYDEIRQLVSKYLKIQGGLVSFYG